MSKPVLQRPQAEADIIAMADYLHDQSPDAALQFIDAVEAACALLSAHPASGSTRHAWLLPELPVQLRFHPLRGFPRVLIYYLDLPEAVDVVRVWDASRGLEALMDEAGVPKPSP